MLWHFAQAMCLRLVSLAVGPSCSNKRPGDRCNSKLPTRPDNRLPVGWSAAPPKVETGCSQAANGRASTYPPVNFPASSNGRRKPSAHGTHSLRRTKVCLLYKKTGNLRACQLLLGHTKLESTVRYLGVELGDALQLSEALEL